MQSIKTKTHGMAHCIHLAVCDILYNKNNPPSQHQEDSLVIEKGEGTVSAEDEHVDDIEEEDLDNLESDSEPGLQRSGTFGRNANY